MTERLAIVTGTSAGIGLAIARAFVDDGWRVVGTARRDCPLDAPGYTHARADLGDPSGLRAFVDDAVAPAVARGGLERVALVNNAALVGALGWLRDAEPEALDNLFAVNATAPIVLMGRVHRLLGPDVPLRIVNVSSGAAHNAYPGLGDYCATKAALRIAGQAFAAELELAGRAPREVAVLSFEPGLVETDMQRTARASSPEAFPGHGAFVQFEQEGLLHPPEAVTADVVRWCASDPTERFTETRFGE